MKLWQICVGLFLSGAAVMGALCGTGYTDAFENRAIHLFTVNAVLVVGLLGVHFFYLRLRKQVTSEGYIHGIFLAISGSLVASALEKVFLLSDVETREIIINFSLSLALLLISVREICRYRSRPAQT